MNIAYSKNGVPIRLTYERWTHIVEHHEDMASSMDDVFETIENPEIIIRGHDGALQSVASRNKERKLIVIYRELSKTDGFVITAFHTSKVKGVVLWHR